MIKLSFQIKSDFKIINLKGWEENNKYVIRNINNEQIYYALESIFYIYYHRNIS